MNRILSLDVDLHRIHAWSNADGRVCYDSPDIPFNAIDKHDLILMEVGSNVFYDRNPAVVHNAAKWLLYNSFVFGRLYCYMNTRCRLDSFLVSPSSEWTCGYEEEMRHELAGCTGQHNHDIRETIAMQYFHSKSPGKWVHPDVYIKSLSAAGKRQLAVTRKRKKQTT